MKSIAIMQPTFLPWIGYFAMIDRVDDFVFLDNVAFDHRSWQQRNRIKTAQGASWLTVPVQAKGNRGQLVKDTQIQYDGGNPLEKIAKTLEHTYGKAAFYREYAPKIIAIFESKPKKINDLNVALIEYFCDAFEIKKKFSSASDLKADGAKADLLANICEEKGADLYISAPGSREYLEESDVFERKNIPYAYHEYKHPQYVQMHGEFIPYMCAADLLFNEGPKSLKIIRSGMQ